MPAFSEILELVEKTPFIDTHEHLLEESTRLQGPENAVRPERALKDFSVLLSHCADSDLVVAGLPGKVGGWAEWC